MHVQQKRGWYVAPCCNNIDPVYQQLIKVWFSVVKRLKTQDPVMDIEDLVMAGTRQRFVLRLF